MNYGLGDSGFTLKRFPEIKAELEDLLAAQFGSIDTSADSVFGQLIGVLSKPIADVWEQMDNVYGSQYPSMAAGISLDNAVALTGITRRPSTFSTGIVGLKGTAGSDVAESTQLQVSGGGATFATNDLATIQNTDIARIYINIDAVTQNADYVAKVNGTDHFYQAGAESPTEVAAGLKAVLEAACAAIFSVVQTDAGSALYLVQKAGSFTMEVRCRVHGSGSPGTLIDNQISWWTPIEVTALLTGDNRAPANSLTVILQPVSGLDLVTNFTIVTAGRAPETDAALRLRRAQSLAVAGAGTVEAIRSKILDPIAGVAGVIAAYVYENVELVTVGGMEGKSLKLVVQGGEEQAIADFLWRVKPAGIKTLGDIAKTVIDSQGIEQTLRFSRPYQRQVWVRADLYLYDEEIFPAGGDEQVAEAIYNYGNTLQIGDDLIFQRFFGIIYTIPGIGSVNLYLALPNVIITINALQFANLGELVNKPLVGLLALNPSLVDNDTFMVNGDNDTVDTALATAKGSAPAQYDLFKLTSVSTPTITYLGNLNDNTAPYPAYVQENIPVSGSEYSVFDLARMNINVHP